ncbi:MAG: hypothetical protein ACK4OK_09590 [Thermoflexus sp.]
MGDFSVKDMQRLPNLWGLGVWMEGYLSVLVEGMRGVLDRVPDEDEIWKELWRRHPLPIHLAEVVVLAVVGKEGLAWETRDRLLWYVVKRAWGFHANSAKRYRGLCWKFFPWKSAHDREVMWSCFPFVRPSHWWSPDAAYLPSDEEVQAACGLFLRWRRLLEDWRENARYYFRQVSWVFRAAEWEDPDPQEIAARAAIVWLTEPPMREFIRAAIEGRTAQASPPAAPEELVQTASL